MKSKPEYIRLLYLLSSRIHLIRSRDIYILPDVKLNSAALSMLNVIGRNDGVSSVELSGIMNVSKSAVSQMITKLDRHELILKRQSGTSRKSFSLYLTEKGKRCVEEYRVVHDRFYDSIDGVLRELGEEKAQAVLEFLTKVNDAVKDFDGNCLAKGALPNGGQEADS